MATMTEMDMAIARSIGRAAAAEQGNWVPACGGAEVPFHTKSGFRLLYCWQATTGRHAYLNCDTDIILSDEEALTILGVTALKHILLFLALLPIGAISVYAVLKAAAFVVTIMTGAL